MEPLENSLSPSAEFICSPSAQLFSILCVGDRFSFAIQTDKMGRWNKLRKAQRMEEQGDGIGEAQVHSANFHRILGRFGWKGAERSIRSIPMGRDNFL